MYLHLGIYLGICSIWVTAERRPGPTRAAPGSQKSLARAERRSAGAQFPTDTKHHEVYVYRSIVFYSIYIYIYICIVFCSILYIHSTL